MTTDYWSEGIRARIKRNLAEGSGIYSEIRERDRDAVAEKLERGFATGKPFHVILPQASGAVNVLSLSPVSAVMNSYPGRDEAQKCTKRDASDHTWADAPWIE